MDSRTMLPLMSAMAAIMSYEEHIDEIQEALTNFKMNPEDEQLRGILCGKMQLFMLKDIHDKEGMSDPFSAFKRASEFGEIVNVAKKIIKPDEN